MIKLVTFADDSMRRSAELCINSAGRHGADVHSLWTPDELRYVGLYDKHQAILDEPRGCGLWMWKPAIILDTLLSNDADLVVYADAGIEFINNLHYITDRMTSDIWLFGNQYEHAHWCKRDIVEAIMPWPKPTMQFDVAMSAERRFRWECEMPWARFGKQCQASVIFIRNSEYSRRFVKEWLDFCTIKHLIDDSPSIAPNHPEFRENRHDQAILTTLAYREGIKLRWWPASYNNGAFTYPTDGYDKETYPILFNHHRGVQTGERAA